jgi:hypothetical protein
MSASLRWRTVDVLVAVAAGKYSPDLVLSLSPVLLWSALREKIPAEEAPEKLLDMILSVPFKSVGILFGAFGSKDLGAK